MLFWSWLTANGLAFAEGRSFHRGELGQKILDEKLTITEDPYHPELGGMPFDMEGFPTKKVTLVENGTIKAVVHDRRSAEMCAQENTGHASPQPDARGASPSSLVVATGDKSVEDMIADTKRGLLVTKLHYTNVVNAQEVSITGMTRAGTFLVEDGKVGHAVKNMRFTQSLLTAFEDIEAIGNEDPRQRRRFVWWQFRRTGHEDRQMALQLANRVLVVRRVARFLLRLPEVTREGSTDRPSVILRSRVGRLTPSNPLVSFCSSRFCAVPVRCGGLPWPQCSGRHPGRSAPWA